MRLELPGRGAAFVLARRLAVASDDRGWVELADGGCWMNGLGRLEAAVMDVLWDSAEPLRVRDVLERLAPQRRLAYTTVMTVLENLHRKEWVVRERDGRAYRYEPAATRDEAAAQAMRRALDAIGDPENALLHFARSASDREVAALRKALDRRRRRP